MNFKRQGLWRNDHAFVTKKWFCKMCVLGGPVPRHVAVVLSWSSAAVPRCCCCCLLLAADDDDDDDAAAAAC
jgi:hypothetical protein